MERSKPSERTLFASASTQPPSYGNTYSTSIFFGDDKWVVSSHQPPAPGSLNSIDLLVEGWDTEPPKAVSYLLLIGGKAGLATPGEVEEVEQRALAACKEHSHRRTLWAMTYFGPNARLWAYTSEIESLVSFFPETEDGNARIQDAVVKTSTYLDFAEHESHFINSFHHIEQNPDPSPARFLRAKEQVPSQAMIENRPKDSGDAI